MDENQPIPWDVLPLDPSPEESGLYQPTPIIFPVLFSQSAPCPFVVPGEYLEVPPMTPAKVAELVARSSKSPKKRKHTKRLTTKKSSTARAHNSKPGGPVTRSATKKARESTKQG